MEPDYVKIFDVHLVEEWIKVNDQLIDIRLAVGQGYAIDWMGVWSDKKMHPVQNDFSCMISPEMFESVFLDNLVRQMKSLEHVLYHVDGPGAFQLVDTLLQVDRINVFQIHPGTGNPSAMHYMETLKKVQDKGRGLHITLPANDVKWALETLDHKGLFIRVYADTVKEAIEIEELADTFRKYN